MKIVFRDQFGNEIAGPESTVLDANSPVDTWIDNQPLQGVAPPGTVGVEAFILFIQVANAAGAAHFDDMVFRQLPMSMEFEQANLPMSFDLSIRARGGIPFGQLFHFYSFDALNAALPNTGGIGGLHISNADIGIQINPASMAISPFGGFMDMNGDSTLILPGSLASQLTGFEVFGIGIQINLMSMPDFTNVASYVFQ